MQGRAAIPGLTNGGSLASDVASDPIDISKAIGFAVQAVISGSPVGTLKLQGSCDDGPVVSNWDDVGSSSAAISAAGIQSWNMSGAFYKWVRVVWTRTSGSGSISVSAFLKEGA